MTCKSAGQEDRRIMKTTELMTRAVLFVPQTPMGVLVKDTKEVCQRMEHLTKFR